MKSRLSFACIEIFRHWVVSGYAEPHMMHGEWKEGRKTSWSFLCDAVLQLPAVNAGALQ